MSTFLVLVLLLVNVSFVESFAVQRSAFSVTSSSAHVGRALRMSETESAASSSDASTAVAAAEDDDDEVDPMEAAEMDAATRIALEKSKRADELRAQEVFMKKSTGRFECTNCDWVYDETKGDSMMIGGLVQPGTSFSDLPSNWRCPVCRASKDSFREEVVEIPGFEVNQNYGLGGNSMTSDQKNLLIFGGLGTFFFLFIAGYALN